MSNVKLSDMAHPNLWWSPGVFGVDESTFRWVFFRVAGLGLFD
jgi:hypothetical protein